MERMKKMLSSPMQRRKHEPSSPMTGAQKHRHGGGGVSYLGVPLSVLVQREGKAVPSLVTKVCSFIRHKGMELEGIFRVSGNARLVEQLKTAYNTKGDADIEAVGDVMAVAGLLKCFLRELPEGVVPEEQTKILVQIQQELVRKEEQCMIQFSNVLEKLPPSNYHLLHFLCHFLQQITQKQSLNKMSPTALGIVFGPNVFRCGEGLDGLKNQGITNHIMCKFISNYDKLFDAEPSHELPDMKKGKLAPPRPPPPSVGALSYKQAWSTDVTDEGSDETPRSRADSMPTSILSDEEPLDSQRTLSPIPLDSERSELSCIPSPRSNGHSQEQVKKTISCSVAELLFGETVPSSDDNYDISSVPVPKPRKRKEQQKTPEKLGADSGLGEKSDDNTDVQKRIKQFETDSSSEESSPSHLQKPVKQRPSSQAFDVFESSGIVISPIKGGLPEKRSDVIVPVESDDSASSESNTLAHQPRPLPKPRTSPRKSPPIDQDGQDDEDTSFSVVGRGQGTLTGFKRAPGPMNRRTPTRDQIRRSLSQEQPLDALAPTEEEQMASPHAPPKKPIRAFEDINHNDTRPSIKFLDLHHNGTSDDRSSPEKSPSSDQKPYVPPLDLSTLHQHIDSSEAIPAGKGTSLAFHKAKSLRHEEEVVLSPRLNKLKKKNSHPNTEVPPSPPTEQVLFINSSVRSSEEQAMQLKQLTRKIQSCKKRIRMFEESFEEEFGYRPSQSDKAARPEIKKCMQELAKARKDMKRLKEDAESGGVSEVQGETLRSGYSTASESSMPTMDSTLHLLTARLREKRLDASRPDDVALMSREQIQDEKLAVQKSLLYFENLHGRPTTKGEKELMRPLYDRYRTIKRMMTKPASPRDKPLDLLQSVPEDNVLSEFSPLTSATSTDRATEKITIPVAEMEEDDDDDKDEGNTDFLVTRDFGLLARSTLRPAGGWVLPESNHDKEVSLHELSRSQMFEEQQKARNDKKNLRRVLREFEENFLKENGRKVQKEDRAPMDSEYLEYKQVKARLKLLDALLSKHDPIEAF